MHTVGSAWRWEGDGKESGTARRLQPVGVAIVRVGTADCTVCNFNELEMICAG